MLNSEKLSKKLWAEAVSTTYYLKPDESTDITGDRGDQSAKVSNIEQGVLMIEKAHLVYAITLGTIWLYGTARRKYSISLSTVEVEYIAAGNYCTQLL